MSRLESRRSEQNDLDPLVAAFHQVNSDGILDRQGSIPGVAASIGSDLDLWSAAMPSRGSVGARFAGKARGGGLGDDRQLAALLPAGRSWGARALTLIACSHPEAAPTGRATLGQVHQAPPEDLVGAPISAPQPTRCPPVAPILQSCRTYSREAVSMVTSTRCRPSSVGRGPPVRPAAGCCHRRPIRQLRVTGDPAAAVRAGCPPVVLWPPACRACSWRAGPSADAHAGGAWHVNVAGRRCRLADPRSSAATPSARLVAQAGRGRGCRPRGRPTSHQRSSPPALAWPPGQGRRPRRPPRAAFVAPAPPSLHLLQAATQPRSLHWPARRGNHRDRRPGGRRSRRASFNGASPPRAWL
jgi:hypothetical protein